MAVIAFLCFPASVYAQSGGERGWALFFNQDSFDQTVFPIATVQESDGQVMGNSLGMACGADGQLVPFFSRPMQFDLNPIPVSFRADDVQIDVAFRALTVPGLGTVRALVFEDVAAFTELFRSARGAIAYRTEGDQGTFSTVGAATVFDLMLANCP